MEPKNIKKAFRFDVARLHGFYGKAFTKQLEAKLKRHSEATERLLISISVYFHKVIPFQEYASSGNSKIE